MTRARGDKVVAVLLAVITACLFAPTQAWAGPQRVAVWVDYLDRPTRFYNDSDNARAGHDGHCYRGRDNSGDYACTVETRSDRRKLRLEHPTCPTTDIPRICYTVDLAGADPEHPGWNLRWRISADPWYRGQLPYCQPDYVRWQRAYHDSPWTAENVYRCGFWKTLYTGPP